MRFFDDFSRIFHGVKVNIFSKDRLITGTIGHKLDEN